MPRAEEKLAKQTAQALAAAAPHLDPMDRRRLMRLAGRGRVMIVREIKAALDYLNDELSADKVTHLVVPHGAVGRGACAVETFTDPDHGARHRAAVELLAVHGMYPSKNTSGQQALAGAKVEIVLRGAGQEPTVTVVEVGKKPE